MRYLLALTALFGLTFGLTTALYAGSPAPAGAPQLLQAEDDDRDTTDSGFEADGLTALDTGRYAAAKLRFRLALKEDPANQRAARGLAETYDREGEYADALKTLEKVVEAADEADTHTLALQARLMLTTGDYEGVEKIAEVLGERDDTHAKIEVGLYKGHLARHRGLYDKADEHYLTVREVALAQRGADLSIDKEKGRQSELADIWCSAGEAYYWLNRLHEANDCWSNALDADEFHYRTNDWMASIYLQQNNDSASRVDYSEYFLKRNENAAVMHLRLAQAHFYRWRSGMGHESLDRALEINPNHPEALAYRAARYLYTDQYDPAREDYERALEINPHYVEALGAKALHGKMLALDEAYAEAEQAMLAINPKPARFYEIVADGLADRFRYREALPLYEKAIECNPEHWTAYKGRGRAALNFGDDELGKASLEIANEEDPLRNNLETVNLLTLLESYKNFERIESEDGRWRLLVHKSEADVMADIYIEHLEEAYRSQSEKYDYEIEGALTIEAFHRHEDFEVRTVGRTGLPALGACFGNLITLDSPSARPPGSYNWASTLRHEMDHAFQLNISNGQLPRWLAEGLSTYEEKTTRPEWERHMEDQLFMYYHMDALPEIRKFNEWFRDGSRVMFAYYLGNVMLEFIDTELGGFGAVRRMLELFGQKKTPAEVFKTCLGIEPEDFDRQFREYVRDKRIAHLRMVPRISPDRVEELYFRYEDGLADEADLVELALGYLQQGAHFDADTFLGMAKRRGADKAEGDLGARYWYVRSGLYRGDTDMKVAERQAQAKAAIEKAVALGLEDFGTYLQMAQYAQAAQDHEKTLQWLKEANRAYPESPQPYSYMYQMYQQSDDDEKAVEMAEAWMGVDETNLQVRMWLIEEVYDPGAQWEKMADMAVQAINVAPLNPSTHKHHGMALRKLKRWQESVDAFEYVRRLASGDPDEALAMEVNAIVDKAVTWLYAEEFDKCRDELEEAKLLDPDNERVATVEQQLNEIG